MCMDEGLHPATWYFEKLGAPQAPLQMQGWCQRHCDKIIEVPRKGRTDHLVRGRRTRAWIDLVNT